MKFSLGRYVFGLAAIYIGLVAFVWRDFSIWQGIGVLGTLPHHEMLIYLVGFVEVAGGVAILFPRTARAGAIALGALYLAFALLRVPFIVAAPLAYDNYGNFFEQFSLVSGALIVYAAFAANGASRAPSLARIGYYGFALCVVSFTLEQAIYLSGTADFVPKWIPPGQMFWAIATTVAFALAAIALFTGRMALLAAQLTTAMIAGFGLLVWLPAPFTDPHSLTSWAGNGQNAAIAGAAWIVADYLARKGTLSRSS
jgi:uncharacterized membrane protein